MVELVEARISARTVMHDLGKWPTFLKKISILNEQYGYQFMSKLVRRNTTCMFQLKLGNFLIVLIGEIILEKNICYSFCYTFRVMGGNFFDPVIHVALDYRPYSCVVELSQEEKAF